MCAAICIALAAADQEVRPGAEFRRSFHTGNGRLGWAVLESGVCEDFLSAGYTEQRSVTADPRNQPFSLTEVGCRAILEEIGEYKLRAKGLPDR